MVCEFFYGMRRLLRGYQKLTLAGVLVFFVHALEVIDCQSFMWYVKTSPYTSVTTRLPKAYITSLLYVDVFMDGRDECPGYE